MSINSNLNETWHIDIGCRYVYHKNNTRNYLEYVWFLMQLTIFCLLFIYDHCRRPCSFQYIMNIYMYLFQCYKFQRVSIPSFVICVYEVFINSKIACLEFINLLEDTERIDVTLRSTKWRLQSSMAHLGDTPKCITKSGGSHPVMFHNHVR